MSIGQFLATAGFGFLSFLAVDLFWLGFAAKKIYNHYIGDFLRDSFLAAPAAVFYVLYILGVTYFVVRPALESGSLGQAVLNGALLGGFAYMTYELTNYAVLKDWPFGVVVIDIAWGIFLTGAVSGLTFLLANKFVF